MSSNSAAIARPPNIRVIGLISTGHFLSHFYLLLIPPIFPLLAEEFGVGFTELGFAITVFSVVTALTQAPVGFLVDRLGARNILLAGLFVEAVAFAAIGLFPSYWSLVAFLGVAGLANSVYHPADYAILSASVDPSKMGRAFSVHTASGMLGNAVAPVAMVVLMGVTNWQSAVYLCAVFGGAVGILIASNASHLRDPTDEPRPPTPGNGEHRGLRLLLSTPILLGLLFFVGIAVTGQGVSAFGASTLTILHDISVTSAATVLAAYLFASPVGVLVGGWVADRIRAHHIFAATCFVVVASCMFAVAASPMSLVTVSILFVVAGFFSGAVSPSRDMLIRSLTPPGQMGKVFGFVSTGFNIGGMFAPLMFGYLLDHREPSMVFWVVGWASLLTVLTVVGTGTRRKSALAAA